MTSSELIQILCKMDPNTEVFVSLEGYPIRDKEVLSRAYREGKNQVVLTTSKLNYKKK